MNFTNVTGAGKTPKTTGSGTGPAAAGATVGRVPGDNNLPPQGARPADPFTTPTNPEATMAANDAPRLYRIEHLQNVTLGTVTGPAARAWVHAGRRQGLTEEDAMDAYLNDPLLPMPLNGRYRVLADSVFGFYGVEFEVVSERSHRVERVRTGQAKALIEAMEQVA